MRRKHDLYSPMDFHCQQACNAWTESNILSAGWLLGMSDLGMSKDYVWQRIADHFVHLLSIVFSGFRIDAAKSSGPDDLAVMSTKLKSAPGSDLSRDLVHLARGLHWW
jgi:hypothetical protein